MTTRFFFTPVYTRRSAAALLLAATAFGAAAQGFPDKPLKLVVGFPPGTGPDLTARTLGNKLAELLKQNVVVDNRAGAGGQIAAQAVAKSPSDGYTLLLGEVGSISIAPAAYTKLPYDPIKELTPVSEVVRSDFVLVVPVSSAAVDVRGFVTAAKARTDKTNFATFGAGTPGHFGAEVFGEQTGFKVEAIHYRATGDAVTALVAGDVQAALVSVTLAVPQIKGGKMKGLAVTSPARSPLLPDVPTFAEAGFPRMDISAWFAVFAPAGTPPAVLDVLNRQVVAALQAPDVKARLQESGLSVQATSRADAERMVRTEAQRWAGVVKATGFKGD